MDFDDSPDEALFRAAARAWLVANAEPRSTHDDPGMRHLSDDQRVAWAKDWQARKQAAGYAGITLPQAYGGRGGTTVQNVIWRQEEASFRVPFGVFEIQMGMCLPTLLVHGSETQKDRFLTPGIRGDEVWCQMFSEPAAGSDLAGLRTYAAPAPGGWSVNGQKVWTTGAQFSDYGLLLARTDRRAAKHAGLTMFVVDMHAPGVVVRPITQMSGEREFNEVFFTDVFIPDELRVTAAGGGWAAAMTTLMFERLNVGADLGTITYEALLDLARGPLSSDRPAIEDSHLRQRLAQWYLNSQGLRLINYQTLTALGRGQTPGPEQSIAKLVAARQTQEIAEFALDLLEQRGALRAREIGPEWEGIERAWHFGAAMRIAGGTDEILRNIIAERVLGLPADPRPDKTMPFDDL